MSIDDQVKALGDAAQAMVVTRDNYERLLDRGQLEIRMKNGNWWAMRRNGQTQRWKRDANRLRTPFKFGLRFYGELTELDFLSDGRLDPTYYRRREP